jgi:3-hydroxyacyl-CoA dehydrogenase
VAAAAVTLERRGAIAIIGIDNPPVNALGQAIRRGLIEKLAEAAADPGVEAVVVAGAGRAFSAGADITEFGKPPAAPELATVLRALDDSDKPIVAAIGGIALGGGLELALACHYRVAGEGARCGLPEVKLGLIPGAGGTQRLPRLVGVEQALDMIASGEPVAARDASALGLVDAVIEGGDVTAGALAFAREVASQRPLPRARDRNDQIEAARAQPELLEAARVRVVKRARAAEAPLRAWTAVKAAIELPFEEGLRRERELFAEALASPESAAMRHVFFAERAAAKVPDIAGDTPVAPVARAAVIGAGTMGAGIAMVFASAGIPVALIDRDQPLLDAGMARIASNYAATARRGRLSTADVEARLRRITPTTDWQAVAAADLVVEAVFEEMSLKKEVFARLDELCKPGAGAILATNTSTLDVNEIARATARPEQVIGLHFFSPANVMRLVEVVRGARTAKPVVATCMKLVKDLGKVGVLVGVCDGFVGNRMLHQYWREASFLLEEGATPAEVDGAMTGFGMAMGPLATSDLAGIDVGWRIRRAKLHPPAGERYFGAVPDRLAEMGRYGQKTGRGYYRYEGSDRTPIPDLEVQAIIEEVSRRFGLERRAIGAEEVLERCLYAMVNEGAKILDEGIALRASDIDTVWVNGYGFPAHRGGPMFWADQVGLPKILDRVRAFESAHGKIWRPAPLLERLARNGGTFTGGGGA